MRSQPGMLAASGGAVDRSFRKNFGVSSCELQKKELQSFETE